MAETQLLVLSDIHYAGEAEKQRKGTYEVQGVDNPLARMLLRSWRYFIWRRDPFGHNTQLQRFMNEAEDPKLVIANGDFSCDTAYLGVSDDAACESANLALTQLRQRFGSRFHATIGDHELGKTSLAGGRGGMRLASWERSIGPLHLHPFWTVKLGRYLLIGVTSSLIAFPVYEPETLSEERAGWQSLRKLHLEQIRGVFETSGPDQKILLFCHDPTALPFLYAEPRIRERLHQVEHTIIGHLHSPLLLWKSRILAGMPRIHFLGNAIRRMSVALHQASCWKQFKVKLCPALSGIELLNDGGYFRVRLDPETDRPSVFTFCPLPSPDR